MMTLFSVIFAAMVTVTVASELSPLQVVLHGNVSDDEGVITIRTARSKCKEKDAYDLRMETQNISYRTGLWSGPKFECFRWDEDKDWELSICAPPGGTLTFYSFELELQNIR